MTTPHAKPLPAYTEKLWKCIAQYAIDPYKRRGKKASLSDHAGIAPARLADILAGAPVDDKEHRALARVFGVLKHFPQLRLSFVTPVAPLEAVVPTPPAARTVRPNLALVTDTRVHAAAVATTPTPATTESPMAPAVPPPSPPSPVSQPTPIAQPVLARPLLPQLKARNFGEALRACREAEAMTHAQLGELVGVTGSSVGHWERGTVVPVLVCYTKLLELFPALGHAPRPKMKNGAVPTGFPKAKREELAAQRTSGVTADAPVVLPPAAPMPTSTDAPRFLAPQIGVAAQTGSPAALIAFGRALGQFGVADVAPFRALLRAAHAAGVDCAGLADALAPAGGRS